MDSPSPGTTDDVELRTNEAPEMPTSKMHESRSVLFPDGFDAGDPRDVKATIVRWTVEYQPSDSFITEDGLRNAVPHAEERDVEDAAQHLYKVLQAALFPNMKNPPLMVQADYTIGQSVYADPDDFPHSVSVGSFL